MKTAKYRLEAILACNALENGREVTVISECEADNSAVMYLTCGNTRRAVFTRALGLFHTDYNRTDLLEHFTVILDEGGQVVVRGYND